MHLGRKIGLSLSGGGYRAAAFHLGTLQKLHQLKIIEKIDVISTISGGSIIGAYYGLNKDNFEQFENGIKNRLNQSTIQSIILTPRFVISSIILLSLLFLIVFFVFTDLAWLSPVIMILCLFLFARFQYILLPLSKIVERVYDKMFFNHKSLSDLPVSPEIVINATNLETTTLFSFSKRKMEDSSYKFKRNKEKLFKHEFFPISTAVAASTCVPVFFSPVKIDRKYYNTPSNYNSVSPNLVDGGVYDNQGIHKITQTGSSYECQVIISSDAGNILPFENKYYNVLAVLLRTSDIFMRRIKSLQFIHNIYLNKSDKKRQIAYFSLGWDVENCVIGFADNLIKGNIIDEVIKAHNIPLSIIDKDKKDEIIAFMKGVIMYEEIISSNPPPENIDNIRKTGTNLTALSLRRIDELSKFAALLTEIQIKLYCPILLH